jgi:hypothetical protein
MPPRLASSNFVYCGALNTVFSGERFTISFVLKYLSHFIRRQFHRPRSFAFLSHVARIVGSGPEKEMSRVYAQCDIACVADTHSFGNRTVKVFVACTVNVDVIVNTSTSTYDAISVFRARSRSCPKPAAFGANSLCQQSVYQHGGNLGIVPDRSQVHTEAA